MGANDNAFPSSPDKYEPEFGLNKRELIAAMAMQGLLVNSCNARSKLEHKELLVTISGMAAQAADALIERLAADPVAEGASNE
jgi:hypothetical protein